MRLFWEVRALGGWGLGFRTRASEGLGILDLGFRVEGFGTFGL